MIEPWNDPTVLPPPVFTSLCHKISVSDMKLLKNSLLNALRVLSMQSPLHQEAAILSRFIYKFDKKFRSDIGFRYFKKVNTSLRKYLALNFHVDVKNFIETLPSNNDDPYLPTKQMIEYLLVRMQTFSKLMVRICVSSKQAAIFYMHRVKQGESHWMSLMPYALLCRLWSMSKVLLEHTCDWYSIVNLFCDKLVSKGVNFLPEGYELPNDLRKWINITALDNFGRLSWSNNKSFEIGDDEEEFDSLVEYVNIINSIETNEDVKEDIVEDKSFPEMLTNSSNQSIEINQVDCGEKISRDIFKKLCSQNLDSYNHTTENVTNKFSLDRFIQTEEEFRNNKKEQALSSHLTFMQWQALKVALVNLKESLATNRKIERKFKKIWQEKCLAYV